MVLSAQSSVVAMRELASEHCLLASPALKENRLLVVDRSVDRGRSERCSKSGGRVPSQLGLLVHVMTFVSSKLGRV